MRYLMAHDLGTSGNKAVLYNTRGEAVAQASANYPTHYPFGNAAQQDPEDWWAAFCKTCQELLAQTGCAPGDILALSFSAQMNACLPVDRQGQPLRPAMIWADQRADEQAERLSQELGRDRVYQITGQRLSASSGISKMAWFREHEPALYLQTAAFLQPKDYLISRLTGQLVSDYSDASHLACLDINALAWSDEVLMASGVDKARLPRLLPSTAVAGRLRPDAARACGLLAGTPVVTGGGDGPCATAGAGLSSPGQSYCCLGTSAWIASLLARPYLDPQARTFNLVYLDGRQVMALGATQAAGLSLSWAVDTLFSEFDDKSQVYARLEEHLDQVPAGSADLLFLPYLLGERSPWWNAQASGSFLGLHPGHGRSHLLRAVLEGVGLNLKLVQDALEEGNAVEQLTMIGGGARNRAWLQILADIWQKELPVPRQLQTATSLGAMLCAGVGAGVFDSLEAARHLNPVAELIRPNQEHAEVYQRALARFTRVYHALNAADYQQR
ncbi:MAG: xylulokinase [Clostridiales bacterium]|nr:xylulokinase [Clostridiales bacterium]